MYVAIFVSELNDTVFQSFSCFQVLFTAKGLLKQPAHLNDLTFISNYKDYRRSFRFISDTKIMTIHQLMLDHVTCKYMHRIV